MTTPRIMYAIVSTRLDLAYALSIMSRFMENPGKSHWQNLKWVLRYQKGSFEIGLCYDGKSCSSVELIGYVDFDFADCLDTIKSLLGYIFIAFGGADSWKTCIQKVVALSTIKAEYIVATKAIKESFWLKGLVAKSGISKGDVIVFCDNQSALHLMKNPMFHERSKHIDIKFHFIRETICKGSVVVKKINIDENPVDALAKCLCQAKFRHCLNLVRMESN